MADLPDHPASVSTAVLAVVHTVHEVVVELAALCAQADAVARVRHVPIDERGVAMKLVKGLAPPPPRGRSS